VRELQRVMTAAVVMADRVIMPEDLPEHVRVAPEPYASAVVADRSDGSKEDISALFRSGTGLTLGEIKEWAGREAQKRVIQELQQRTNITRQELARMLGIDPKTLRSRLKEIAAEPNE
jgi:DNA-binding NtrC family response regulator